MAKNAQQRQLTTYGLYALTPFVLSAAAMWLSPTILPQYVALDFHQLSLAYSALFIAYLAGAGAGTSLSPAQKLRESFLPGLLITLVAFAAILPNGVFFISIGAAWRHVVILVLLVYLLLRDMNASAAGLFPKWYSALRMRLTFWAGISIVLIISRLVLWGYY